ncbi:MAG: phosphatase PAP2 family protein [Candidatus Cybelea sp.]
MRRTAALVALLIAVLTPASAGAEQHYYYLNPAQLDLTLMLPPPPDVATAQSRADEADVAAVLAARTRTQVFQAEEESERTVFFYAPAIGQEFTAARLPITARFFARVGSDVKNLIDAAKAYWNRPRPGGRQNKRGSYPSGHAAFAAASAILLAQLVPAKRDAVFTQARTFAEDRIVLGRHYPSDIASGWTAGTLATYVMMQDQGFNRDFAEAKAELRRAGF